MTTVSHALSGQGRVAEATRRRVLSIAEDLGYRANVHAQRLVWGRSQTLAVQIAAFTAAGGQSVMLPDAPYFMDVLNGAAGAAALRGYALVLAPHDIDAEQIHALALDGAIVVDPTGDEVLVKELRARDKPVVTTSRPTRGPVDGPWVDNDHGGLARRMLDHLRAMGYRRPALVATTPTRSYVADIIGAYRTWTAEHGLEPIVVELAEPPAQRAAARAANRLLAAANRPDAVYATYEPLALGVLLQAQRMDIAVPEQLGIASAVDGDVLRWATPHVTSVNLNARRIGAEAVGLLVDLVEGRSPETCTITVPSRVVPRSSTRPSGSSTRSGRPRRAPRAQPARSV